MDYLRYFEQQQIKMTDRPQLRAGDIVRVDMKITEGDKERIQPFEGTVLGIRGSGPSITFTVRREVGRFAVERIFPLYSPLITHIDIVKRQKVRRAKLTYLREEGRRRVKEDSKAMQWHVRSEQEKKRLAEESVKHEEEKKHQEEIQAKQADLAAEAKKAKEAQAKERAEASAAQPRSEASASTTGAAAEQPAAETPAPPAEDKPTA